MNQSKDEEAHAKYQNLGEFLKQDSDVTGSNMSKSGK